MGTPSLDRWTKKKQKTEGWLFTQFTWIFWAEWTKRAVWCGHRGWNLDHILWHSQQTLQQTVRGSVLTETDQLFYDQVFRAESDYLPCFSTAVDLWHLTFFLRRQRSLPSTTLKWFSRELKIPSVSNAQRSKPRKRCFSTTMQPPHKAKLTTTYLNKRGFSVLEHPPYSPDLAPCDFWLFPILKNRLAGRKFDRAQDLAKAVKLELLSIPKGVPKSISKFAEKIGKMRTGAGRILWRNVKIWTRSDNKYVSYKPILNNS